MHLILPKTHPVLDAYRELPLFFLAGPILGGGDWHLKMIEMIMENYGEFIVVNPSRYLPDHPHYKYRMPGIADVFERQTDWERYYLKQAADVWPTGCIIFWLGCESKEHPRTDGNAYATDTRGEIGEWRGHLMYAPHMRVVIGAEKDFPGLSVIKRNFELAVPHFRICATMEEVVERAARYC